METLLEHQVWVRELARRLVRDPNVADDVAQEAVLAAMKPGGEEPASPKAWLARVVKNLVWERARGEENRRFREHTTARGERTSSTLELVERMSGHRAVVDEVMGLPDHYREVLLHRYFDGQTPTEIAAALEVPIATVKTRLQRALALMRERLDKSHGGDGRTWMSALVPLLDAPGRDVVSAEVGGVGAFAWIVAATALLGAAVFGVMQLRPNNTPRADPLLTPSLSTAAGDGAAWEENATEPERSQAASAEAQATEPSQDLAMRSRSLNAGRHRGRVIGVDGMPLPGVVVRFRGTRNSGGASAGEAIAISDQDGNFELLGAGGAGRIEVLGDTWVSVLEPVTSWSESSASEGELVLMLAPAGTLKGRVEDESGRAIAGASLRWVEPPGMRAGWTSLLDRSGARLFRVESGAEGTFDFGATPVVEGAALLAEAPGYLPWNEPWPELANGHRIVLRQPAFEEGMLRGRVVDERGAPIANAAISNGHQIVLSDASGLFHVHVDQPAPWGELPSSLLARAMGKRAAHYDLAGNAGEGPGDWVELVLHDEALTICGRVVDRRGHPLRGIRVWIADPTVFVDPSRPGEESVETNVLSVDPTLYRGPDLVEASDRDAGWTPVRTDEDGAFVLEGLFDRDYVVEAMDTGSLARARREGVSAGEASLELVLDVRSQVRPVEGRVVDRHGEPLQGVRVTPRVDALRVRAGKRVIQRQITSAASQRTGSDGTFWFDALPADVHLRLEGPGVLTADFGHADGESERLFGSELEISLARRIRLSVELADPQMADGFLVLDEEGEPLRLDSLRGRTRVSTSRGALSKGRSETYVLSDAAASVVLLLGEKRLSSKPVHADVQGVVELRF